jgi:hypothetical protein
MPVDWPKIRAAANLLGARRWVAAGEAYRAACSAGDLVELPADEQFRRNLALNMADLAIHRPRVVKAIESSPGDARFDLDMTASGRPTVTFNGTKLGGEDPMGALAATMEGLKPIRMSGEPIGILGSSDGYALVALARHPWPLPLGKEQCIQFFEPNPGQLLLCMMIHDYSGDNGPIRQRRFQWWVGHDCVGQYRDAMINDPGLPAPVVNVASLPDGDRLTRETAQVVTELVALGDILAQQVSRTFAADSAEDSVHRFVEVLGDHPPRRPRALLITTRFSSVLQFSTQDCADGLRDLGWDVEVLMERTPYHSLSILQTRQVLLRHRPDLILQLDHNRSEHGTLFPPSIPFACWAQDHLPNLTDPAAGAAMTPSDFLLTTLGPWYERCFKYPKSQVVPLGKLTKITPLPETWQSDGPDLAYVSNASKLPAHALAETVDAFTPHPIPQKVAAAAGQRLIALYEEGRSFDGTLGVLRVVEETATAIGIGPDFPGKPEVVTELFERVNNLCYRQQSLSWLAAAAEQCGLNLALYGNNWAKHPTLGKYAKGTVNYGPDLEALTRAAKINFQIVPAFCLHQRLLDGLAAGGFFLVRSHPADTACLRLARFVDAHLPPDVGTLDLARKVVAPEHLPELQRLAAENAYIADRMDPIEIIRVLQATGLFQNGQPMPPRIDEVSFDGPAQLRQRLARFIDDPDLRREIALEQHAAVASTLGYTEGLKRVLDQIRHRLAARLPVAPSVIPAATPALRSVA